MAAHCSSELSERLAAWRHELSPWLSALHSRLSLSIDCLPDRDTIQRKTWIYFDVPDQTESAIVRAAGHVDRSWRQWLEALELLDLLATVDEAVCWALLVQLCDAAALTEQRGCPVEFFHGAQPKYEFRFPHSFPPTDSIVALVLGTSDSRRRWASPAFEQTKTLLLAALGADTKRRPSICCRFRFSLPHSDEYAISTAYVDATVGILKRALALARDVRRHTRSIDVPHSFALRAFGFYFPPFELRAEMRDLLRRIAMHIPIFDLTYHKSGRWYDRNEEAIGPFQWRLLAPHATAARPHAVLGARRLTLSARDANHGEIAAMCSAIAQSRSLREVTFHDNTLHDYNSGSVPWLPYLAFALFHDSAAHQIGAVQLSLNTSSASKMTRVLTEPNPVTYLAALYDGTAASGAYNRPPLTRVRVKAQAKLVHRPGSFAYDIKTLYDGKQDVECLVAGHDYGEFIRVLAPGVGFCFVRREDVLCETVVEHTRTHPVRSLTLRVSRFYDVAAIASLLAAVGAPLTQLTIMNVGERSDDPMCLDELLAACPRVTRLELSRLTLSRKSFTSPQWGRQLESLTLRSCGMRGWCMSVRVTGAMLPRLGSLVVDARDTAHSPHFQAFLLDLAAARALSRFVVMCDEEKAKAAYHAYSEKHNGDRTCALPLRHKLAVLSAVTAGGVSPRAKYALNADVLSLVFEMVAPQIRHRMCVLVD